MMLTPLKQPALTNIRRPGQLIPNRNQLRMIDEGYVASDQQGHTAYTPGTLNRYHKGLFRGIAPGKSVLLGVTMQTLDADLTTLPALLNIFDASGAQTGTANIIPDSDTGRLPVLGTYGPMAFFETTMTDDMASVLIVAGDVDCLTTVVSFTGNFLSYAAATGTDQVALTAAADDYVVCSTLNHSPDQMIGLYWDEENPRTYTYADPSGQTISRVLDYTGTTLSVTTITSEVLAVVALERA